MTTDDKKPTPAKNSPPPPSTPRVSGGPNPAHYPNPPEISNPDAATLREQWRFAIRQYSKMYSHAWGTAILAGVSFFALGWVIKGGNPLPSVSSGDRRDSPFPPEEDAATTVHVEEKNGLIKR